MNFDRLTALLLERAIRGELVPQLESEPAVEQIGEALTDVPFAIPGKWKWAKLGQVFALKAGKFIAASEIKDCGEFPCYGGNGIRGFVGCYNREGRFPLIGRQGALCGNINLADGKFYATEHAVVADGGNRVDPDCAAFFLKALNLNQYATQTAQPGLSVKRISETPFPVPPVEEQRRIVRKLDGLLGEANRAKVAHEELCKYGENLRKRVLQEAMRGALVPQLEAEPAVEKVGQAPKDVPFAIPAKWIWSRLGDVLSYGRLSQVSPDEISADTWILDLEDIEKDTGRLICKKKGVNVSSNKAKFRNGDVLYGKLRPYLNKVIVADEDGVCSTEIIPISVNSAVVPLDAGFLKAYLMSPLFVDYANQCSYGVKMPRLGTKDARAALIPIPPIEEQRRIVQKLTELLGEVEKLSA